MKVDNSYVYIDSGILATINLIEIFDVKIPRKEIRQHFQEVCNGRSVAIKDIKEVLPKVGITPYLYEVEHIGGLKRQKNPFITWKTGTDGDIEFLCVLKVGEQQIEYINEYSVCATEDLTDFEKSWQNVILLANPQTGVQDPEAVALEGMVRKKFEDEIEVWDNFAAPGLCDEIISYCGRNDLFNRSRVSNTDSNDPNFKGDISIYRTSDTAKINDFEAIAGLKELYEKISDSLKIPVDYMESFQCVRYLSKTFFSPHFDTAQSLATPGNIRL